VSDVLFKELDLPHERLRKTKSGHFSTASDVLENLVEQDETGIAQKMLEYREMQKLKSTYVDSLPTMIHPLTGRLHTSLSQTGAATGRLSSSNPNLQNIPIRNEAGRQIRRGFVARPGWQFVAADYSQVELRILAHVSGDTGLVEAFRLDQDIHKATAAAVFSIPLEKVTFEQRRFAKAVNFGLIYGMGAFRLARDSEMTLGEAERFIEAYFKQFPGIQGYLEGTKRQAAEKGYVETLLGRRRYFEILRPKSSANHNEKERARREAINHPIQGTAADIIKLAMVEIHKALQEGGYSAKMLLQIHDELIFEAPEAEVEAVHELVVRLMSNAYQLAVPLKVEASVGKSWYALKE
jgi:DNA polymerase-1